MEIVGLKMFSLQCAQAPGCLDGRWHALGVHIQLHKGAWLCCMSCNYMQVSPLSCADQNLAGWLTGRAGKPHLPGMAGA